MSLVRLASSNGNPIKRACRDCRYYEPEMDVFWGTARRIWSWKRSPPFVSFRVEPTAEGHRQAVCTAFGGFMASVERSRDGDCGPEGRMFAPSPAPRGEETA